MDDKDKNEDKTWRLKTIIKEEDKERAQQFQQAEWLCALLRLRGLTDAGDLAVFLNGDLRDLPDPFLLTDMEKAVQRLLRAQENGETVAIYGDYDADGVTATALMVRGLQRLGFPPPITYIPDRFDEGYGMNIEALGFLLGDGAELIISVDCGITAVKEAEFLRRQGIDLIVTDHHQPGSELPEAVAVVNPQRRLGDYPCHHLAGVGVAYELIRALSQRLAKPEALQELTALVAIGTLGDMMELSSVNRLLVRDGLKTLQACRQPGIRALMELAGINGELSSQSVTFGIVPKINASGRMQHADIALELVLCDDPDEAYALAQELNSLNDLRKQTEQEVYKEALEQFEQQDDSEKRQPVQLFYAPHWHPGVLGIVAAKLIDKLKRPVLVASADEEGVKGSGRAPEGYNLYQMLCEAEELLSRFGGHFQAAGFSCSEENLWRLRDKLCSMMKTSRPQPVRLAADLEMPSGGDWQGIYRGLRRLEPLGNGNEEPIWLLRGVQVRQARLMGQGEHLSAQLSYQGAPIEMIAWRKGAEMAQFNGMVDMLAKLVRSVFRGQEKMRLEMVDWRPTQVDHLELIQKIRGLPENLVLFYSMEESYTALMESGRTEACAESPHYNDRYPFLPQTCVHTLGKGGKGCSLDTLFEREERVQRDLSTPLQQRAWRLRAEALLPDLKALRGYYRWLRDTGSCAWSEIPWQSMPGGLQGRHAEQALANVLEVFGEAGFLSCEEGEEGRSIIFNDNPQQTKLEELESFRILQERRKQLLPTI